MKQQSQRIQFLERSIDSLKEKYLAEVAGQQSRQATAATGGESHSGSEVDGLREKVVVMRRQTDALSKKLDGALAEASHSEEVRLRTVTRCLAMMSAEDAAPRREQVILSEQMQLQREQKALEAREAEYLAKQSLLERKEMTLRRTSQPVRPTGGVLPSIANPGASTSGQLVVSASQELFGGVDSSSCGIVRRPSATSSAGSSAGSSAPHAAMKLAPLSQRPPSLTEPMVEHPQRLHS
jgi:hypothetical protein